MVISRFLSLNLRKCEHMDQALSEDQVRFLNKAEQGTRFDLNGTPRLIRLGETPYKAKENTLPVPHNFKSIELIRTESRDFSLFFWTPKMHTFESPAKSYFYIPVASGSINFWSIWRLWKRKRVQRSSSSSMSWIKGVADREAPNSCRNPTRG